MSDLGVVIFAVGGPLAFGLIMAFLTRSNPNRQDNRFRRYDAYENRIKFLEERVKMLEEQNNGQSPQKSSIRSLKDS